MKCPHCQNLAADVDKVCYTCKRYMGNERATNKVGGDTNFARILPLAFVVFGVPAFHMAMPRIWIQFIRYDTYDWNRVTYSIMAGFVLLTVGWILGRLLGDGTTVRI